MNLEVTIQLALCHESFPANSALFSENSREVSTLMASELLAAFELQVAEIAMMRALCCVHELVTSL